MLTRDCNRACSAFLNKTLNFLGVALALFMIANVYQWTTHDKVIKRQVRCKYCRKYISAKVRLFSFC